MDITQASRQPLQVFVVEDSAPVSERLQELVDSIEGAHCAGSATTAGAAIEEIRRLRPDAVILDVRLAQGSGFDVMRALREDEPHPAFYVLTSFALDPYRRLALKLGATRTLLEQHVARHAN
jgi:DNA-binding NarL/FixJ family response regulator